MTSPGGALRSQRAEQEADVIVVDIVVNNFNYGRYVGDAIESALRQTHPHVNVIAVDDGSSDGSPELLAAFEGRVELVLKANGGQASAVNAGFARCTGDVVLFLDADDMLHPEAAALVAEAFAADPRVVKVQFRMDVIDRDGRPLQIVKPPRHLPLPEGDVQREELVFPFDLCWLPMSANAFRVEALRTIIPIPEHDYPVCGADWYLVHLAAMLGRVVSLEEIGASYRVHGGNRYEPEHPSLDVGHVRHALDHSAATTRAITQLANELGLALPHGRILSVAHVSNRLVSLKLEPALHPVRGDRVWRLALDGSRAAVRRFDVAWPMKLLYVGWFWVLAVTPARFARRLCEFFLFPERRGALNRILGRFHTQTARHSS